MKIRGVPSLLCAALVLACAGCHQQPASNAVRSDHQIAGDVQARLHAESALSGQNIQVTVSGGVVTLSGTASDAASRALAGNDAGAVSGVHTVVNNLQVQPPQTASAAPESQRAAAHERHAHEAAARRPSRPPSTAAAAIPPPAMPSTPAPPPQPVVRTVVLQTGTVVPVRISDALDSATAQPNQSFHGTLAADLISNGMIAAPHGTPVLGRVVDARSAARFSGSSLLSVELTRIDLRGNHLAVVTDTFSKEGQGRGKSTAEKVGGGALLGTLIGALAGGGKGAAIGAIAGAGAGTGVSAATRGQQVQIASETLINFTLQSPVTVTTTRAVGSPPPANQEAEEPVLHTRPPQ